MSHETIPASDAQLRDISGLISFQVLRLAAFPEYTVEGITPYGVPIISEDVAWTAELTMRTLARISVPYRRTLGIVDKAELVYLPLHAYPDGKKLHLAGPEVALFIDEPAQPGLESLTYRIEPHKGREDKWEGYRHENPLEGADYNESSSRRLSYDEGESLLAIAAVLARLPDDHFAAGDYL